ncbi:MAG: hypothetical protein ACR2N6_09635 [Miltoncostaeaceae bacterium]
MIRLALDKPRYAPGDAVHGTVTINETIGPRRVYAAIRMVERTKDLAATAAETTTPALADGELVAGSEYVFELVLDAGALPSVRSTNGRIGWEAVAWIDQQGGDSTASVEFEVVGPAPS